MRECCLPSASLLPRPQASFPPALPLLQAAGRKLSGICAVPNLLAPLGAVLLPAYLLVYLTAHCRCSRELTADGSATAAILNGKDAPKNR